MSHISQELRENALKIIEHYYMRLLKIHHIMNILWWQFEKDKIMSQFMIWPISQMRPNIHTFNIYV